MRQPESWIERAARLHPERVALQTADETTTYAQLERASAAIAGALRAVAAPGEYAAVPATADATFAAALHGCLRAGVVVVPIDQRLPAAQQASRTSGCAVAYSHSEWARLAARRPVATVGVGPQLAGVGADAATAAVLMYTSGSTGPGTPVLLSRGNLLWNALGSAVALGQPAQERWLSAMPVSHVGGLTVLVRSAVAATTAVLRPRFTADEQAELLMAGAATITSVVPTMLSRLLDAGLRRPPQLRLVLLGGAPITPQLVARAAEAEVPITGTYGMTEACSQVITAGAPLFCTEVALRGELAAGAGSAASGDAPNDELLVRGPTVAAGAAGAGGWLATGDRGRRTSDGRLDVVGRLAETIITGGENVAPTEVEAQLLAQPGIVDAAVLGVPDAEWGQRLEARVVLAAGATLDSATLRAELRTQLPSFAVPKVVTAVEHLPRTPTGKLRRSELT